MQTIEGYFASGHMHLVDTLLRETDFGKISSRESCGLIRCTFRNREKLSNWAEARDSIAASEKDQEALFIGMEPPDRGNFTQEKTIDPDCICRGNWRLIISECRSDIEKKFISHDDKEFTFFGLVDGSDDYYYGMYSKDHGLRLLSCVGSIDGHGYLPKVMDMEIRAALTATGVPEA